MGEGEGSGGYAGAIAEDAATGWGGKHGTAEAGDEVWGCSSFSQGSYKVYFVVNIQMGCGGVSYNLVIMGRAGAPRSGGRRGGFPQVEEIMEK